MATCNLFVCVVAVVAVVGVLHQHQLEVDASLSGTVRAVDDTVLQRLAQLEQGQRESQAEIQFLREMDTVQLNTIREQGRRIADLEHQLATRREEIQLNIIKEQGQRIADLEHQLATSRERIKTNTDILNGVERKLTDINHTFLQRKRPLASLADTKNRGNGTTITKRKRRSNQTIQTTRGGIVHNKYLHNRQVSGGIAFTVYLGQDVNLGAHQTLKFDQVITNDGGGYSTHTGVFTCSEAGVYMFTFSVAERDQNQYLRAELVLNSRNLIDAAVDTEHPAQDLQGGNTVVVKLDTGDLVWVDAAHSGVHVEGGTGFRLTTFTGIFLYA